MARKRNPLKQIMSDVHKDHRAGRIDLTEHGGFIAEVRRRAQAAGLPDDALHDVMSPRRHDPADDSEKPADPNS